MQRETEQHRALVEIVEWWEDIHDRSIGSQAVIVKAPHGWGRTHLLEQIATHLASDTSHSGIVVQIPGSHAPDELALQVRWLEELLERTGHLDGLRAALGLHRIETFTERALGLASIAGVLHGRLAAAAGLPATVALGAVAWNRDRSEAGQLAAVTRISSGLARRTADLPMAVLIDDADLLSPDLVEHLVVPSLDRLGSNVLFCIVCAGDTDLVERLTDRQRHLSTVERVSHVDIDADMDETARRRLAQLFAPNWPDAAIDRLAEETRSFAEIWAILALPRAGDIPFLDAAAACGAVDGLVADVAGEGSPGLPDRVLAWAGGVMHSLQFDRAVRALGATAEPDAFGARHAIAIFGVAVRFVRSADRVRATVGAGSFADLQRTAAASAVVSTAVELCTTTPVPDPIQLVVALRPVLHLAQHGSVVVDRTTAPLLLRLATELEALGDSTYALRVARVALDLLERSEGFIDPPETELTALVLRLSHAGGVTGPPADDATQLALLVDASGALFDFEARVWAAITLLDRESTRAEGAALIDALTVELADRADSFGDSATSWRLLLAYSVGRAGYSALSEGLLAPLLTQDAEDGSSADHAWQVLNAGSGGQADVRLYRTVLRSMMAEAPADADPLEVVLLQGALAELAAEMGEYAEALDWANRELEGRLAVYGPDHRQTLVSRYHAALWTGSAGDASRAVQLFKATVADMTRLLGPDDEGTLMGRHMTALFIARTGQFVEALSLLKPLLQDQERVLGVFASATLGTRHDVAVMTGEAGDASAARTLLERLLPDMERALGSDNIETLRARHNLAHWVGVTGDPFGARERFQVVLSDRERVLGTLHPDTLSTRQNLAYSMGLAGDVDGAIEHLRLVLPDLERVQGAIHPETLRARLNLASWLAVRGDHEGLLVAKALLPNAEAVLGSTHPLTLATIEVIRGMPE